MVELPLRTRLLVVGSAVRSALPWGLPFVGLVTSPWVQIAGLETGGDWTWDLSWGVVITAAVVPVLVALALVLLFPHDRYGDWAARRIAARTGARPSTRTINLTEQLAVATGTGGLRYDVLVHDSPVPNVAALPTRGGAHVVVTAGAERRLDRDALEALLASQIAVVVDPWVRLAAAAQVVGSLRFLLLFASPFLNPFLMPFAFVAFFRPRRADTVRDLVGDAAAVRATRHPGALARAFEELRPAAPHGSRMRVGLPGFLVDQFWVVSTRSKVTTTTSGPRGERTWTTADEVAAELAVRADRSRRVASGETPGGPDLRGWRRATAGLGRDATTSTGIPLALTDAERRTAAEIGAELAGTAGQGARAADWHRGHQ
ncbi:M56 family metallopeptidase [Actinomarinicola tropica]|uniref:M48 family metalloprotease n=1 Tax=Actinomarinicola tropica TaxID=2789776 RepID=A0A5Q2RKK6_9ACTN|nr:M56 family metallopeptidase [Actinomarinicola tropica]QGG96363.1 hypothetical protein GH723_15355 [Actinomarinicola tropica]